MSSRSPQTKRPSTSSSGLSSAESEDMIRGTEIPGSSSVNDMMREDGQIVVGPTLLAAPRGQVLLPRRLGAGTDPKEIVDVVMRHANCAA